jgi:hypothetical protein
MTVPAAIRELDKIEVVRQTDGKYRLDHAVTASQKTILRAFGMDDEFIRKNAQKLSEMLAKYDDVNDYSLFCADKSVSGVEITCFYQLCHI